MCACTGTSRIINVCFFCVCVCARECKCVCACVCCFQTGDTASCLPRWSSWKADREMNDCRCIDCCSLPRCCLLPLSCRSAPCSISPCRRPSTSPLLPLFILLHLPLRPLLHSLHLIFSALSLCVSSILHFAESNCII